MPFDVNQEAITPRVSHFATKLNVENLCGKLTTQLKVSIVNPNGRIDSHRCQNFISRALTIPTAKQSKVSLGIKYMTDHLTFD